MKDKKAAKLLIKRAKKNPNWYTEEEVKLAKRVKREIKHEKKLHDEQSRLTEGEQE